MLCGRAGLLLVLLEALEVRVAASAADAAHDEHDCSDDASQGGDNDRDQDPSDGRSLARVGICISILRRRFATSCDSLCCLLVVCGVLKAFDSLFLLLVVHDFLVLASAVNHVDLV